MRQNLTITIEDLEDILSKAKVDLASMPAPNTTKREPVVFIIRSEVDNQLIWQVLL